MAVAVPVDQSATNVQTTSVRLTWGQGNALQPLITSLYGSGEQGAFYVPKPVVDGTQSLFQSTGNVDIVDADSQPVGLMMDQAHGVDFGPELISNGGFSSGTTGWTINNDGGLVVENGVLKVTTGTTYPTDALQTLTGLTVGKTYMVSAMARVGVPGGGTKARLLVGGSGFPSDFTEGGVLTNLSVSFVANATSNPIALRADDGGAGNDYYFDNVSAKEIPGYPARKITAAARPAYKVTPDRLLLDKVDDKLTITVPTGGWTGTMVLATDQGTASYGVSIPAGAYGLGGQHFPGTAIIGALFRDGAMSSGEKTDAESYFVGNGATAGYGAVSNFGRFWQERSDIDDFPLIDTSSATDLSFAWRGCTGILTSP